VLSHAGLNATLNGASACLLTGGYFFIRRGKVTAHMACMALAFLSSTVFLISYLLYHARVGSVHFQGQGWSRPFYFTLLTSHTLLAVAIVPLAIITLSRALRRRFDRHRRIARWTLPLWLYVSVTGVVVYVMLYHIYAPPRL
jgi:uncharacterized membrane protein YozB (DUF420 family)